MPALGDVANSLGDELDLCQDEGGSRVTIWKCNCLSGYAMAAQVPTLWLAQRGNTTKSICGEPAFLHCMLKTLSEAPCLLALPARSPCRRASQNV